MKKQLITLLTITYFLLPTQSCFASNVLQDLNVALNKIAHNTQSTQNVSILKSTNRTGYPDAGNATMNQLLLKGVEANDLEMVQTAVNNGANVNIYYDRNNWSTPLTSAVSNNNIDMADFLLDKGADPNVVVAGRPFILTFLSYNNERSLSLIQHLIDRGANIKAVDNSGNTVFMAFYNTYSSYEYKKNMTSYFISQGVDVNHQNKDGDTPLHKVAARGYADIAQMLLDAGANPNKTNNQFKKPLNNAINSGNRDLINLLLPLTSN